MAELVARELTSTLRTAVRATRLSRPPNAWGAPGGRPNEGRGATSGAPIRHQLTVRELLPGGLRRWQPSQTAKCRSLLHPFGQRLGTRDDSGKIRIFPRGGGGAFFLLDLALRSIGGLVPRLVLPCLFFCSLVEGGRHGTFSMSRHAPVRRSPYPAKWLVLRLRGSDSVAEIHGGGKLPLVGGASSGVGSGVAGGDVFRGGEVVTDGEGVLSGGATGAGAGSAGFRSPRCSGVSQ
jgi:hypothetical protein